MHVTVLSSLLLALASPALARGPAPAPKAHPRALGVIGAALGSHERGFVPVHAPAEKRQESHNHEHFNVVFPQVCVADCQTMVRVAGQMESAAYAAQATERVGGQIGPDLDDDRISDATREGVCTTGNVQAILSCVNCAYGNGVPGLSEDDAEDVIDWFEDFCDDTTAWEQLDDDDDDDVTAQRTATGPFTTVTNVHLPVGFTDYPRSAFQTQRASASSPPLSGSGGGGPRSTGSPTTAPPNQSSSPVTPANSAQPTSGASLSAGLGAPAGVGAFILGLTGVLAAALL